MSQLGDIKTSHPIKTSRRDFAYVVSNKLNGGTTVSGTLIVAGKAGIPIFATGGKLLCSTVSIKLSILRYRYFIAFSLLYCRWYFGHGF